MVDDCFVSVLVEEGHGIRSPCLGRQLIVHVKGSRVHDPNCLDGFVDISGDKDAVLLQMDLFSRKKFDRVVSVDIEDVGKVDADFHIDLGLAGIVIAVMNLVVHLECFECMLDLSD